jgi:hypothetical protein
MPVNDLITIRKGTASQWSSNNPVLASGELGFDTTNNILKIGDGSTSWNSLSNHSHSSSNISDLTESVQDIVGSGFLVAGTGITLNYNDSANTLTISSSGSSVADGSITTAKLDANIVIDCGAYSAIVPNAPTGLTATANSGGTVSLSWTAPTNNGGVSITDYSIQYSTNSGSSWTSWSHSASTSTSATISALSAVSTIFRVAGINSVGTGAYSTSSSAVTPISFTAVAVILTSGTSYSIPSGATTMKAWAVGQGGDGTVGGGAGGTAYKTWSVSAGTVSYAVGATVTRNSSGANTTVTYGGTTISGLGGYYEPTGVATKAGGSYSGGDGGADGGPGVFYNATGLDWLGGGVGGNGVVRSCIRRQATDVSGLFAAVSLAGSTATETCGANAAFGSGGYYDNEAPTRVTGGLGGGSPAGGAARTTGAVVLYFT